MAVPGCFVDRLGSGHNFWRDFDATSKKTGWGSRFIPTGWYDMAVTGIRHESKTRFLNAASHVIRAKGYCATRIEDICDTAGLTKGSFSHPFDSKEAPAQNINMRGSAASNFHRDLNLRPQMQNLHCTGLSLTGNYGRSLALDELNCNPKTHIR